ncbi:hypothetical protein PV328_006406 [Microctonus aethiopoides]|uniref:Ribosome biogenesis regulatory protein n=1 Tax=Microctonus aethiopoides TaxID=144406 RepID=A0AA39KTC3_9HYME|nr:hypothetical protein PV328_006406 [Microctonus aethiopoides]
MEIEIDEGTLLATNYNEFDKEKLKTKTEDYLKSLTTDNVQHLINKVWALPTDRIDEIFVAHLPKPAYILPRARAVPKLKALTKWQEFAKQKGIRSKKKGKSKLQWDDQLNKWVPTFGYQRTKAIEQKEWLVEVGDDNTPKADPRETASKSKQERIAKNELQRLRNLAKANNIKVPKVGLPTTEQFSSAKQLATATTVARVSTASVGKFQSKLPKEKDAKGIAKEVPGLKRKRSAPPLNFADEKKRDSALVDEIVNKKSKKDILRVDIPSTPKETDNSRSKGQKKRGGQSSAKKSKGGKGRRDSHKRVSGRKRRG